MSDDLLERIAVLEREKAELVSSLIERDRRIAGLERENSELEADFAELYDYARAVTNAVFGSDSSELDLSRQNLDVSTARMRATEVRDANDKLRAMHRRAQRAEGLISRGVDADAVEKLRTALGHADRTIGHIAARTNEQRWEILQLKRQVWQEKWRADELTNLAMSEGLKECERLRAELTIAEVVRDMACSSMVQLENEYAKMCLTDDNLIGQLAMTEGLRECERLRGLLAIASASIAWLARCHATSLRDTIEAEQLCSCAMSEGLRECERLRAAVDTYRLLKETLVESESECERLLAVNKLATDAADVAMRLLADARRDEQVANSRIAGLEAQVAVCAKHLPRGPIRRRSSPGRSRSLVTIDRVTVKPKNNAELEALRAKNNAELEALRAKNNAELEALRAKNRLFESELGRLNAENSRLQYELAGAANIKAHHDDLVAREQDMRSRVADLTTQLEQLTKSHGHSVANTTG